MDINISTTSHVYQSFDYRYPYFTWETEQLQRLMKERNIPNRSKYKRKMAMVQALTQYDIQHPEIEEFIRNSLHNVYLSNYDSYLIYVRTNTIVQ